MCGITESSSSSICRTALSQRILSFSASSTALESHESHTQIREYQQLQKPWRWPNNIQQNETPNQKKLSNKKINNITDTAAPGK